MSSRGVKARLGQGDSTDKAMTRTPEQWADSILDGAGDALLKDRIAAALRQAVLDEREACAAIAEDVMRLCGSHAAEQVAALIRARGLSETA